MDFLEQFVEVLAGELPVERLRNRFPVWLEVEEAFGQRVEVLKIVWGKHLSLHDREVDFDLIEPTGVNWQMDQYQARMLRLQALDGPPAAMSGAVVDNPKDSPRFTVRPGSHHLVHQGSERDHPVFPFAASEDARLMNIQGRQVNPRAAALVLMLNPHWFPRLARLRRMPAGSGLNAGFLVGRNDKLIIFQRFTIPEAMVEIEHSSRLESEVRVAREYPTTMLPRADGVFMQPAPEGAATEAGHQARLTHFLDQIGDAPARQWPSMDGRQFTSQRFDLDDQCWGKKSEADPDVDVLPVRPNVLHRSVFATYKRLRGARSNDELSLHCPSHQPPSESSWRGQLDNTVTYTCSLPAPVPRARRLTKQSDKGSFLARRQLTSRCHNAKTAVVLQALVICDCIYEMEY